MRSALEHLRDPRFGVPALAERNTRHDPLAGDGIGHEHREIAILRGHLGDALPAERHIADVELEELPLVEQPFVSCQWSG